MAELERLNKFLAHAGVGSRRHCEELILRGRISINGQVVRELGTRVDPATQEVAVDGTPLTREQPVYWLVNKARGSPRHQSRPIQTAAGDRPHPPARQPARLHRGPAG